jgi:hypothetical protein
LRSSTNVLIAAERAVIIGALSLLVPDMPVEMMHC